MGGNPQNMLNLRQFDHWKTIFSHHSNQSTCDLVFVCEDGAKIAAHKIIIFLAVPELTNIVKNHEYYQELVILIPDVKKSVLEHCIECLYQQGDSSFLLEVLNFKNEDTSLVESIEECLEFEHKIDIPSENDDEMDAKIFLDESFTDSYILNKSDIETVDIENNPYTNFVDKLFENEETARRLVEIYNENHNYCLTTSASNKTTLRFNCYSCTKSKKSTSLGIRKIKPSNDTGCLVRIFFSKRSNGNLKMTQVELKHNHELSDRGPRGKNKEKVFVWHTLADAVVRDGVISNRNAVEIEEQMKNKGIFPLPTLGIISKRMRLIQKMLGIFPEVKESLVKEGKSGEEEPYIL